MNGSCSAHSAVAVFVYIVINIALQDAENPGNEDVQPYCIKGDSLTSRAVCHLSV